jgi:hypothetical protein
MGSVLVVVPDVFFERGEQVPRVVDQDPVEALAAYRAYPPFGEAFARGARGGVRTISMPQW